MTKTKRRTRASRTKVFNFYPGSFWFKRAVFIALMFTIGFNQFMDTVQEDIITESEKFIAAADSIRNTGLKYGGISDDLNQFFSSEIFRSVTAQDPSEIEMMISYGERFVRNAIDKPDFRVPRATEITNDVQRIKAFDKVVTSYRAFFQSAAKIIEWTNILIWFSILGVAAPWLFLHMIYGTRYDRKFTFNWLLVAAVFNAIVLNWLTQTYKSDKQGFWRAFSDLSEIVANYLQF